MIKNIIEKLIYLYFFFSLFLIITIKYEDLYLSTIIGFLIIISILLNKLRYGFSRNDIKYIIFKIILYSFCIYVIMMPIVEKPKLELILYSFNKIIPLILMVQLIDYFKGKELNNLKKYCANLLFAGVMLALILFIFKIAYLQLGLKFEKVTIYQNLSTFSEYRISGLLSHKSRFGLYCILALAMNLKYQSNKKIVTFIKIVIIFITSFMSNSLTTFLALIVVFALNYLVNDTVKNKLNRRKKIGIAIIMFIVSMIVFSAVLSNINSLYGHRNIGTLGARTQIWSYATTYIKQNIYGSIKIPGDLELAGVYYYNNAHNSTLNEFIETGMFGGTLFLIICIYSFILIENKYMKIVYIILFLVCQFDKILYNEVTFIYWGIMSFYICAIKYKKSIKRINLIF